jgi:PII-like signaling protein
MQGYLITFFTQQGRHHKGKPLCEWLLSLAKEMDLPGATQMAAVQGFGHGGGIHSAHFFDLADQPEQLLVVVSDSQARSLLERIVAEGEKIFYVKAAVEYGTVGE